jgi:hypothetical protein
LHVFANNNFVLVDGNDRVVKAAVLQILEMVANAGVEEPRGLVVLRHHKARQTKPGRHAAQVAGQDERRRARLPPLDGDVSACLLVEHEALLRVEAEVNHLPTLVLDRQEGFDPVSGPFGRKQQLAQLGLRV